MNMIDGVLLVVDASDGPQAQTRFVLRKALEAGAKPIVVINKIDRENADPHQVLDQVFDLFVSLHATDEQLDFPTVYTSAKEGYAKIDLKEQSDSMKPLFEAIIKHIPPPRGQGGVGIQDAGGQPGLFGLPGADRVSARFTAARSRWATPPPACTATGGRPRAKSRPYSILRA